MPVVVMARSTSTLIGSAPKPEVIEDRTAIAKISIAFRESFIAQLVSFRERFAPLPLAKRQFKHVLLNSASRASATCFDN